MKIKEVSTMNIRKLAQEKGHNVQGKLKRISDDKFFDRYNNYRVHKRYVDEKGTLYAIDELGAITYIAGEDWVI